MVAGLGTERPEIASNLRTAESKSSYFALFRRSLRLGVIHRAKCARVVLFAFDFDHSRLQGQLIKARLADLGGEPLAAEGGDKN